MRALNVVERAGNKLPDPVTIFLLLCIIVVILSAVISNLGVEEIHPSTKEVVKVVNLLEKEQIQSYLGSIVTNFQSFAPLGLVLVTMLGAGVAEKSGFMEVLMKKGISKVPQKLVTVAIVFAGMLSHNSSRCRIYNITTTCSTCVFRNWKTSSCRYVCSFCRCCRGICSKCYA